MRALVPPRMQCATARLLEVVVVQVEEISSIDVGRREETTVRVCAAHVERNSVGYNRRCVDSRFVFLVVLSRETPRAA